MLKKQTTTTQSQNSNIEHFLVSVLFRILKMIFGEPIVFNRVSVTVGVE